MIVYGAARPARPAVRRSRRPSCATQERISLCTIGAILVLYLAEGGRRLRLELPDDRRRAARRARPAQRAVPPHPRPVGRLLLAADQRAAAVAHHQRRRRRCSVRCRTRSAIWRAKAIALVGFAGVLFYYHARLAIFCLTVGAAHRLSAGSSRAAGAADDAAQPGSARGHHARQRRSLHRPPHRQGLRRGGARGRAQFERASAHFYRTSMKVTSALSVLPPLMEFIGGIAFVLALYYGSREIAAGRLTTGEFVGVHHGAVHDVRAGQEAESRQRRPAAGDGRVRAHLRDARHAHRGARAARRARRCRRSAAASRSSDVSFATTARRVADAATA